MSKSNHFSAPNREHKASAFTAYFGEPENAADLYRSLDHADDIQPEDIMFTTLEGVLYMARKNDMAFTARQKILVIGEHQSTLNLNMPLRSAIYYGRTMERLIPPLDIYKQAAIPIPTPEFYVFYNGSRQQPAERILKLSDSYLEKTDFPMLELKVKMININPSAGHPILQKSRAMYEYSTFIQKIRDLIEDGHTLENAIQLAMNQCLAEGIMVDFIHKHGSEVINMLFTQFNLDDAMKVWKEEALTEGRAEGLAEGRAEGLAPLIQIVRRKLNKKLTAKEISALLEEEESYISAIITLCQSYPEESDLEIARRYI